MTQVNQSESEMMSAKKIGVLAVKTDQQSPELVYPGETALTGEAAFVDFGIEQAFAPTLGLLAIAFVFGDVGNDTVIETDFTGLKRIKSTVGIEKSSGNQESQSLHAAKGTLEVGFQVEGVMMVACDDPGRSDDVALRLGDRQNIRSFRAFSVLISDTFATFFRQRVTPIKVQLRQIQLLLNGLDTLLPDPLETAIGAPFLKVIVDRLPANLFFSDSLASGAIGNCVH